MKRNVLILLSLFIIIVSCNKDWLDKKPDISLAVPSRLDDLLALLDNPAMNSSYPTALEIAATDYYVTYADWAARSDDDRENYIWHQNAQYSNNWSQPYNKILVANLVLEQLQKITSSPVDTALYNYIKGAAHFYRGFTYYLLSQAYCPPYDAASDNPYGLPLRTTSDFNQPSARSTVVETYDFIINDFKTALKYLPLTNRYPSRPAKPAVYAALARVFLCIEQYEWAGRYADSCLLIYNTLVNYNTLNAAATNPFVVFNPEVIFHAQSVTSAIFNPARTKVDSVLFNSYHTNDLRKTVFFRNNNNGTYTFKATYTGQTGGSIFHGLATDEIYLVRAEAFARSGNTAEAMNDLNTLLIKRWKTGTFIPFSASTPQQALDLILLERRKQLCFRGLRWTDLRRLNKDPRYAQTLTRVLDNGTSVETYTLAPNDPRYTFMIPEEAIILGGIPQNPR